ncbi:MAG: SGNH/GDSL hydrolase family protein [Clostridia bacterium]|nr:SGNH/GDSL hydrolase family protein [Clostridia bacterium]
MELKGKTVFFLGSSVTYGSASGGISFADLMVERCGIKAIKEAVSGTTLADIDDSSYVARLKRADPSCAPDLFICQLSTNDAGRGIPLEQTEAAIREIISYVREVFDCPIMFYTGTKFESVPYERMIELLRSLQKEYGFAILDLWNDPDMLAVSAGDYARYMADPVHPTLAGYSEWWLPKFIEACEVI